MSDKGKSPRLPSAAVEMGVRYRYRIRAAIDLVLLGIAVVGASLLRYDFDLSEPEWIRVAAIIPVFCLLQLAIGLLSGLYVGRARLGSFDEVAHLANSLLLTTSIVAVLNIFVLDRLVPASVPWIAGVLALGMMLGSRYLWRLFLERRQRPDDSTAKRVVVFGAGEGGAQAITAMLRNKQSPFVPVALLDDDEGKVHLKIMGVPVLGRRVDLPEVAAATGAEALVIAVPTIQASIVRDLASIAGEAGLRTLILPPVDRLLGESVNLTDIRPLSEEDLLGRVQIDTDIEAIAEYLTDRRVLVTGAGGSIGSELCRQISRFAPSELIMLERDESALHAVQLSLDGRGLLDDPNLVIADIRDAQRVQEVFDQYAPEVVFHTAALKHVPLLELHPEEGHKTNVVGTKNLLDAALRTGVTRFVNISTDKAADPINVLGRTKRMAEQLTSRAAECAEGDFMSVRFGNVLGSRGSVLVAFRQQIEDGGPVTVTHRDVTRYFMTIPEAVELVIQAGAIGDAGDAFVLDMGEPVRIYEVARRLVEQAERPVEIVFTGLRPGEKLHEVLLGEDEMGAPTSHPLITRVNVPARAFADF